MQFASAFLHGFVVLESAVIQPSTEGRAKQCTATVPVPEIDGFVGSIECELLDSAVSNDNLCASVSAFILFNAKQYTPGEIVYVAAKCVALSNEPLILDATIHQT